MNYLSIFFSILWLFACTKDRQPGQQATENKSEAIIDIKLTIEIVKLKDTLYNPGIAVRANIKNRTGKDIFFYLPHIQTWCNYEGRKVRVGPENSPLGVIPENYDPWSDTINNLAFDLANEMIKNKPELRDSNDVQRFIFSANVIFLKKEEEKELIDGITSIHFRSPPVNCAVVASTIWTTIEDANKILDAPPTSYHGYEFWTEPVYSDTVFLRIR